MRSLNGRTGIILHLYHHSTDIDWDDSNHTDEVPFKLSQKGIAEAVDLSVSRTNRLVNDLVRDGLAEEDLKRVEAKPRRIKVYRLTSKGEDKAKEIFQQLKDKKVKLIKDSSKQEIKIENLDSFIGTPHPFLTAIKLIDEDGVINLDRLQEDGVFTGREERLELMKQKFESDVHEKNKTTTILIEGRYGMGKTTLVNKFKEEILSEEAIILKGSGSSDERREYLPFIEAFNDLNYPSKPDFESEEREKKQITFSETADFLRSLTDKDGKTLILSIDDLHNLDRSSLSLFHHLYETLERESIMLIGTYRPEDVSTPSYLNDLISDIKNSESAVHLELNPLNKEDIKEMIRLLLGKIDLPKEFVKLIHGLSEGNPLFTKKLVNHLKEKGALQPRSGKFPRDEENINIDEIASEIIDEKLNKLDKEELRILQIASLTGKKIPFKLLKEMVDKDVYDLLDDIHSLTELGFLQNDPDEDFLKFNNKLIQLAIYETIPSTLRKDLERNIESKKKLWEILSDHDIEEYYPYSSMNLATSRF